MKIANLERAAQIARDLPTLEAIRADLAAIDAKHEAWLEAQRAAEAAEKAAADKVAAEMKIEAQRAKDEAVAARLSEKFNVKTKKK